MRIAELGITKDGKTKTYRIFPGEERTVYGNPDTFVDWIGPKARLWANGKSLHAEPNALPQQLNTPDAVFSLSLKPWGLRKDLGHLPRHILGIIGGSTWEGLGDIFG